MADDIKSTGAYPFWLRKPEWSQPQKSWLLSQLLEVSFDKSVTLIGDPYTEYTPHRFKFKFVSSTKEEEFVLLTFFNEVACGKYSKFWIPSWVKQFEMTQVTSAMQSFIDVKNDGFSSSYKGHERIAIVLRNGDLIVRKIQSVTVLSAAEERLFLSNFIGRELSPSDVASICFFCLVRFDQDEIELEYLTELESATELQVVELITEYQTYTSTTTTSTSSSTTTTTSTTTTSSSTTSTTSTSSSTSSTASTTSTFSTTSSTASTTSTASTSTTTTTTRPWLEADSIIESQVMNLTEPNLEFEIFS